MNYKLFHVDDCMYVSAATEEEARKFVQDECGEDCGQHIEPGHLDMPVTLANVDDGEEATPETMTTAKELIDEHLRKGGPLPFTVCFDSGM